MAYYRFLILNIFILFQCLFFSWNASWNEMTLLLDDIPILKQQDWTQQEQDYVNHIENSIAKASIPNADKKDATKLTPEIMMINGLTGHRIRFFLNHLCSLPNTSHLHVGLWEGATFISALYKNENSIIQAIGIDSWIWEDKKKQRKEKCIQNINEHLKNIPFLIYDKKFQDVSPNFDYPINIYLYDADHKYNSSKQAFTHFDPCFEPSFIAVIDDWIQTEVREGTKDAFKELGYKIVKQWCIPWYYGFYIVVLRK